MPYVVKSGDSLSKIAARLGMTWQEIYALNKDVIGSNPNLIKPGQTFVLPGEEGTSSGGSSGGSTSSNTVDAGGVEVSPRKPGVPTGEDKNHGGIGIDDGDPETPDLTILKSRNMQWFFDGASGKWFVQYGLPNLGKDLLFEADPDQMNALFGKNMRPDQFTRIRTETLLARSNVLFAGNIAEMEGEGWFEDEYEKVMSMAKNNGQLPSWMEGSGKAEDLLFIAVTENKSNDWLMAEFSKLPEFKARFPGLEEIRKTGNLTLAEAVDGFLEYEAGVKQAINALGMGGKAGMQLTGMGPEGVTPEVIGGLLEKGWSLKATTDALQTFNRAQQFAPAMQAFNQILQANGLDPITSTKDMFEFMNGAAPKNYYDLYEASSIQEAANQAGLGDVFSAQDAIEAALGGDHTRDTATQAMQKAAQLLLRLRAEVDTGKFGLTQDELIDISLGQAPSSGRSEAEVFEEVNRATLAAKANLEKRVRPYTGYTSKGVPQQASLGALREQS